MPIFVMVFQLTISVSNTNEHYPVCTQQLFTFFIPRSIQTRVSFGQVLATDADVGDRVEYYIDGNNGGEWLTLRPVVHFHGLLCSQTTGFIKLI